MYTSDKEAEKIYSSLFHKRIPEQIRLRFNDVSKKVDAHYSQEEVRDYLKVINMVGDLEALEYAARFLRRMPMLTEKFKVMIYLSETIPDNFPLFVNENSNRFSGYLSLSCSLLRSGWKLMKGAVLFATH
jgi:hypothetical protein